MNTDTPTKPQKRDAKGHFIKDTAPKGKPADGTTIPKAELNAIMDDLGYKPVDVVASLRAFASRYADFKARAERQDREIVQLRMLAYSDYPGGSEPYKLLFRRLKECSEEQSKTIAKLNVTVDAQRAMISDLRSINGKLIKAIVYLATVLPIAVVAAFYFGFKFFRG